MELHVTKYIVLVSRNPFINPLTTMLKITKEGENKFVLSRYDNDVKGYTICTSKIWYSAYGLNWLTIEKEIDRKKLFSWHYYSKVFDFSKDTIEYYYSFNIK